MEITKIGLHYLILLIIVTRIILVYKGIGSGFVYTGAANAAIVDSKGSITANPFVESHDTLNKQANDKSVRLLVVLLMTFLHQITALSFDVLHFLPIMGIILPIVGYLVAKELLHSELYAFAYGLFLVFDSDISYLTYHSNIQGYGFLYYLLLVMFSFRLMEKKSPDRSYFSFMTVFSVMTLLSYYATEFYSFLHFLMLFFFGCLTSIHSPGQHSRSSRTWFSLSFISIILISSFEPVFTNFLRVISLGYGKDPFQSIHTYIDDIRSMVGSDSAYPVYVTSRIISSYYIFPVNMTLYTIILLPIFLYLFCIPERIWPLKSTFLIILITGIINSCMYLLWGGYVDNKFVLIMYSLLGLMAIMELSSKVRTANRKRLVERLYVTILVSAVLLKSLLVFTGPWAEVSLSRKMVTINNSAWIIRHISPSKPNVFLTSVDSGGPLLLAGALQGRYEDVLVYIYKSRESISFLHTGLGASLEYLKSSYAPTMYLKEKYAVRGIHAEELEVSFIVISVDELSHPCVAGNWIVFPPLSNVSTLYNSPFANLVYDGGRTILLRV